MVTATVAGVVGGSGMAGWVASRPPGDVGSLAAGATAAASPRAAASQGPAAFASSTRTGAAAGTASPSPSTDPEAVLRRRPTAVAVASLSISAPVTVASVNATTRALNVPVDPATLGWWAGGGAPGASSGTVVLAGHVDYNGRPGALYPLSRVEIGALVVVTSADGTKHDYRVVTRRHVVKTRLADTGVFRTDGPPRLALITCGGAFNTATHSYRDNLIVLALPV
ncbi:sortase family enzyme [Frankia torreyi]|uniref:Sortase family enzyme n=1 Tax=Frankia torreyi TaxID=1856 RepID=A0A0D8B9T7_9ACTN|nr:sortase family enzyme [Frankia torreyi]KQM02415.1 sortase family enzyme [Frankia sp. CpI1-P]